MRSVIVMATALALAACGRNPEATNAAAPTRLTSVAVDLPADDGQFPAGPHADAVNLHCTACHSTSMVLTQPPLSADQWKAEVTKMREAYKAPVPEAAVPDILAYLNAMSASRAIGQANSALAPTSAAKAASSSGVSN